MMEFSQLVMAERARLVKKASVVKGRHQFTISMTYFNYNYARQESYAIGHNDQYMNNYNRLDFVLRKFSDWVKYRTQWFIRDKNMKKGPEFMLSGNNKILWTTADEKDEDTIRAKQIVLGGQYYHNRMQFEKTENSVLIQGLLNGQIKVTKCPDYNKCLAEMKELLKNKNYMPIVLLRNGNVRTYTRGLTNQNSNQHFADHWFSNTAIH
jgi:hypothetical protein